MITIDGMFVVDNNRRVTIYNKQFIDIGEVVYLNSWKESCGAVKFKDNKVIGVVWSCRDVTAKRSTEKVLKSKISELERFNKFVVGREMKMMEMKQKIHKLEKQVYDLEKQV